MTFSFGFDFLDTAVCARWIPLSRFIECMIIDVQREQDLIPHVG